jgi:hypothetical protein
MPRIPVSDIPKPVAYLNAWKSAAPQKTAQERACKDCCFFF